MHRSENIREPSGDRTSREITFEHGISGNLTRPLIDTTGLGNRVDPDSQPDSVQILLNIARREGYRLRAKLTGGVGVGDPKDYQPTKIAEHHFSEDDLEHLKLEKAKNQGATASSSNASHEASSNFEAVYYHSDDDWTVVEEELTYQWPSRPKNPEKQVQPNDRVIYQDQRLGEGYRPRAPQGLEHIVRSFSPDWKGINAKIDVINSEKNSEQYRDRLNEAVLKDVELAKSIAKEFFREKIEKAKSKLYDEINNVENSKLKKLKSEMRNQKLEKQSLPEIVEQEDKLEEFKHSKESMKQKLYKLKEQKEDILKEHKSRRDKILSSITKHENKLEGLKDKKRNLKTHRDKVSNDQEIKQNEKELNDLKEQKNKELGEIVKYKDELQKIGRFEENLQKIKQLEENLQKLQEKRDEFASELLQGRLAQNQEYAANRHMKEVESILKRDSKSILQPPRVSLFRSNGIRF